MEGHEHLWLPTCAGACLITRLVSFRIVLISKALSVVLLNTEGKACRGRECLQQSLLQLYSLFPPSYPSNKHKHTHIELPEEAGSLFLDLADF